MSQLSTQMLNVLKDIADGFGSHGTAYTGRKRAGRYATLRALRRRGLLGSDDLTEAGRKALEDAKKSKLAAKQ